MAAYLQKTSMAPYRNRGTGARLWEDAFSLAFSNSVMVPRRCSMFPLFSNVAQKNACCQQKSIPSAYSLDCLRRTCVWHIFCIIGIVEIEHSIKRRYPMTCYTCIKCNKSWLIPDGNADPVPSGSLCKPCLKDSLVPVYRKRQSLENNFDCFGRAQDYCDQFQCKYRELCLK